MRLFSFSFLIASTATLGHLYLYRRLLRHLVPGRKGRLAVIAVLTTVTTLLYLRRPLRKILSPEWSDAFSVGSYAWMAVGLALIIATGAMDLVRIGLFLHQKLRLPFRLPIPALPRLRLKLPIPILGRAAMRSSERAQDSVAGKGSDSILSGPDEALDRVEDEERREFVLRTLPRLALAGGIVTFGYGSWRAWDGHRVNEVAVHVPGLPKALDGFTIVQLTDLHVGPFIERKYVDKVVELANRLKPDLVAITGDLVDGSVSRLGPSVAGLSGLRSRYGTYFVTGNHDYYSGDAEWTAFLESLGIQVLRNRHVTIGDAGGKFDLVGVDDWSGGRSRGRKGYDLDLALAGRNEDHAAVLLAHQPANFHEAAARGIGLQISGHTHGGQIFPGTHLVGLQWEYVAGLYRHQDSHIFVSRGCGFWGPPLRIGSPPEIARIVLTA